MNRRLGTVVGVTLLLAGILLALGVTLSVVFYDAGLLMLLGLLLAGVPMILGAVLLVRLSDRPYPDDLIATNAGFVWVAPVMAAIALLFYHFLLREVDIVVSFLIYEASIVAVTALLLWRPWYPFSFFLHTLSPNSLSVARLKVLSFLKSHECLRFSLRMTVWMTFGLMTATIVLAFLLSSGYLPSTGRAEFTTPWSFVVGVVMSLVPAVLTAFCIQVGGVLCYILKHWDHVQATYPPFPRAVVPRAFYMGSTKRLMAEPHYPPETAADQHNLLLHPPPYRQTELAARRAHSLLDDWNPMVVRRGLPSTGDAAVAAPLRPACTHAACAVHDHSGILTPPVWTPPVAEPISTSQLSTGLSRARWSDLMGRGRDL